MTGTVCFSGFWDYNVILQPLSTSEHFAVVGAKYRRAGEDTNIGKVSKLGFGIRKPNVRRRSCLFAEKRPTEKMILVNQDDVITLAPAQPVSVTRMTVEGPMRKLEDGDWEPVSAIDQYGMVRIRNLRTGSRFTVCTVDRNAAPVCSREQTGFSSSRRREHRDVTSHFRVL